jgi:hypothetical protein
LGQIVVQVAQVRDVVDAAALKSEACAVGEDLSEA